jgi:carboxymethylenebutenolidase
MDCNTRWIDIQAADGTFGAYLALPRVGKGPGIVLIQEIFGVNAHIRTVCEQYAADGYIVLAPDIFWRQAPRVELSYNEQDWKRASALKQATDQQKALADIAATIDALRAQPGVGPRVASIGYCFGGMLSYMTALGGKVDAAIAYYGGGIQERLDQADSLAVPLQMHFGGKDQYIPPEAVKKIATAFGEREEVEIHIYPEAEHGFNCSHRSTYHQRSAAEAHGHSLLFLSEQL